MAANPEQPRFSVHRPYRPSGDQLAAALKNIQGFLTERLDPRIHHVAPIHQGMNTNFAVYLKGQEEPTFQLKILTHRGYPSLEKIRCCQQYLEQMNVMVPDVVMAHDDTAMVPNGFIVQRWLHGTSAEGLEVEEWVPRFVHELQQVHSKPLPFFGTIEPGPRYASIQQYYRSLDEVIAQSFGATLSQPMTLWDLQEEGWVTPGIISETMDRVQGLASNLGPWTSHFCHGDMSAANLLLTGQGSAVLDWDESRSHVWPSELARTLFFYDNQRIAEVFVEHYKSVDGFLDEAEVIMTLEHVRQLLRYLCMNSFNQTDRQMVRDKNRFVEQRIRDRWQRRYLT